MGNFKFNSKICTDKVQSERLLALGLKKETADMALIENWDYDLKDGKFFTGEYFERPIDYTEGMTGHYIPAWSLHRLIEMMPECLTYYGKLHYISIREHQVKYVMDGVSDGYFGCWGGYTLYDKVINCIEGLIKEGYFPKEYLV